MICHRGWWGEGWGPLRVASAPPPAGLPGPAGAVLPLAPRGRGRPAAGFLPPGAVCVSQSVEDAQSRGCRCQSLHTSASQGAQTKSLFLLGEKL